jgi:hypothetical protein
MSVTVRDMALSPLGGSCTSDKDCSEGTKPTCFQQWAFNVPETDATPGGYCTSSCTSDSDCGPSGTCVSEGTYGNWCFAPCQQPSDCRSPGYACFYDSAVPHCFPAANLDCDPTVADGACGTSIEPGGCVRYALGPGKTGYCFQACAVGPGSCPPVNGTAKQCVAYDFRNDSYQGQSLGDKYAGGICVNRDVQNATGQECLNTARRDAQYACVDGDECFYAAAFKGGDNLCHPLCYGDGVDGGTAAGCAQPATCHDAFGLFSTSNPIGLCY